MLIPKTLLRRLFQSYLFILLISLVAISAFSLGTLRHIYHRRVMLDLSSESVMVSRILPEQVSWDTAEQINAIINRIGEGMDTRITVILPDGRVVADTREDYRQMDNHADRPEIGDALSGDTGRSTRYSYTLGRDLVYVAMPVERSGKIIAVMRLSTSVESIAGTLRDQYYRFAIAVIIVALVAAGLSYIVSRWINRPITDLTRGARQYASGHLDFRIASTGIDEFDILADAMNSMAGQLDTRFHTILKQRNQLEAVLAGMVEVVFAVDPQGRVTEFNRAAIPYFILDADQVKGRHIEEVIRNTRLQRFVTSALSQEDVVEDEIVLHTDGERTLQAHGSRILGASSEITGAVIVLNDITRIKRLEAVRRDFVANVSHELKTPITSIIGFVETLRDGALSDERNGPEFLEIILKHARRLNAIIEDLLSLSRIEQDAMRCAASTESCRLKKVLETSLAMCETHAKERRIEVVMESPDIELCCNSALLEQALVNLVENAIKYSDEGSKVLVRASRENKRVLIDVIDTGHGIPREHLDRIFERFYRVDKGRSRAMGGTGLGLAIVKHIVNAHNGSITVESSLGKGSTFTINLPG